LETSAADSQSPISPKSSMLGAMIIVLPEECGGEEAAVGQPSGCNQDRSARGPQIRSVTKLGDTVH
jgi:hypothetical protein